MAKKTKAEALAELSQAYETHLEDAMGHLYNRFVAYIAESRLPLPQALLVLKMVEQEVMIQARQRYMGIDA
jgi:hypothetical protein